jgi:3-deoxy-D-manno-octulosonic-acid transferase
MMWWLYNLLFPVAYACLLPHFLLRMLRRGGYRRGFLQRFARYGRDVAPLLDASGRPVWIQAVSVGELAVAFSLMDELRRLDPAVRFVVTCNTSTGHALALKRLAPPDVTLYFPMDVPGVMRRALRRIRPSAIVLVENEIWPNWIRTAAGMGIPAIMVNGRISAHSHKGYRKLRPFTRDLLPRIRWFCMQTDGDRDRLLDLGAPADRMEVTGSAKYDIAPTPPEARARARAVLDRAGIGPGRRILVGGSTWDGEETALLDFYAHNRAAHPDWFLVLVPRHAERREAVLAAIAERKLTVLQRSRFPDGAPAPGTVPDVLLVDTTGELRGFYAAADVVFVGKSLTQTGGQNPIEPARDARPVVVGPHMENFPGISGDFDRAGAWVQVRDAAGLESVLARLLSDPAECARLGAAASALVDRHAGATRRMAERIQDLRWSGDRNE